ncbi:MAG: CvpA family protein [Oscillospiraceae bacterium]|nr:CvpA family protein [Oscillospiraceae bacterium]
MHILLDLLIIAILAFCAWQGYKRGAIGGVLAIIFIIVAIYGGNLVARTYSDEFTTMFRPFVSGYLDRAELEAIEEIVPPALQEFSTEDLFRMEPEMEPTVARQVFIDLGVHPNRTDGLVEQYLDYRAAGFTVNGAMTEVLVYAFCFYLVYIIGFLLILIGLTVIYNILHLSFRLPGLKLVDEIGGGVLGFVQGLLLVFMLTWALGYAGLILPEDLIANSWVTGLFVGANPIVGLIQLY